MNASDYRDQVARELAAGDQSRSRSRSEEASIVPADDLAQLQDTSAAESDRIGAMRRLGAASFDIVGFAEFRPDYLQVLRTIALQNNPTELRDEALSVLALASDDVAQAFLKDCLDAPDGKSVSPALALRLLAIDDHANVAQIARRLFDQSDDDELKAEALRALASDPQAEPLMEKVFRASDEVIELRQIAGTALRQSNPSSFGRLATDILADSQESDELRATTMATLSTLGNRLNGEHRAKLASSVDDLRSSAKGLLKQSADRLQQPAQSTDTGDLSRGRRSDDDSDGELSVTRKF